MRVLVHPRDRMCWSWKRVGHNSVVWCEEWGVEVQGARVVSREPEAVLPEAPGQEV